MSNVLSAKGGDRIARSLRWLQHSYEASTVTDEFLYLMLSIEGISKLLGDPSKMFWRCERCETQYKTCPNCNLSTARETSGSALIREFLKKNLGWSGRQWNDLYAIRSKIAHGDQDLSKKDAIKLASALYELEKAVIAALKFVLKLPPEAPPKNIRQRDMFGGARLHVTYTHGAEQAQTE